MTYYVDDKNVLRIWVKSDKVFQTKTFAWSIFF